MKNLNAFELTKTKKLFLLDMDGTVYHGDVPIPGAVDFIEDLLRRGIHELDLLLAVRQQNPVADILQEPLRDRIIELRKEEKK